MRHGMEPWAVECVERMQKRLIKHHTFELSRERLFKNALTRVPGECIGLTGPSRNGKTSLAIEFEKELNPKSRDTWMKQRQVVRLTCRNRGDRGVFTTKSFYLDALREIRHPMYVCDMADPERIHEFNRRVDRETNSVLASVLEDTLEFLGTKYLIIDETHHLKYMQGGQQTALQMMESFKTLAAARGLVLIFVGAYPMLDITKLSTHMLGRNHTIDMPRYRRADPVDVERFEGLLAWYSEGLRFADGVTSLRDWNDHIYEETQGVIGLLSSWLRSALAEMAVQGAHTLAWTHMNYARPPTEDRANIMDEISVGEAYLGVGDSRGRALGDLKRTPVRRRQAANGSRLRPFEKKPKRDPSGGRS